MEKMKKTQSLKIDMYKTGFNMEILDFCFLSIHKL